MPSTKPPAGTRDFLPQEVRRREYVIGVVREVYEGYGFEPLETPAFENIETLLGKYGEEGNRLIFKILKRGEHEATGEADLALRYDLTVPLARVVAQYQNELPKFWKRYQIQPVWRADRPARGRFREFYQCDVDSIGSKSPVIEVEILGAACDVLTRLGFTGFRVLLNHRRVLKGLLAVAGVQPSQEETVLVALDKFDKIGESGVRTEFATRGIDPITSSRVIAMLRDIYTFPLDGQPSSARSINDARLESLQTFLVGTEYEAAADELKAIIHLLSDSPASRHVYIDPRLARGLAYYTGAIMEVAFEGIGSLGGGGRYDNLVGMFLGKDVPACGFSLGLERIIVVMTERGMFPAAVAGAGVDVMVTLWNEDSRADAMALAAELRRAGLHVDIYPEPEKLGKQFKYASNRHVPFVVIVGDDERALGNVSIKDLLSGEQQIVARGEAAEHVVTKLRLRRQA